MKIRGLGYLGLEGTNLGAWRTFASGILGLSEVAGPTSFGSRAYFKMDDRQWRICIEDGNRNGLGFLGWEIANPAEFASAVDELRAAGVSVRRASSATLEARGVAELVQFEDPVGNQLELFWGQKEDFEPFRSPAGVSAFKTAGLGLGHVLLAVPETRPMLDFYLKVLGFRLTDFIGMGGGRSAQFMRCNPRHHSVGVMDILPQPGLLHFMVEVATLDDLGHAYDRALASGAEITNSIGRHTNDKTISFYLRSPGGFGVEYGWDGLLIDDASWSVIEFQGKGDLWGHHGPMMAKIMSARPDQIASGVG